MKRKIVQIVDRFISTDDEAILVALADDGTLWEGCTRLVNNDEVMAFNVLPYLERNGRTAPERIYQFYWEQIPGLPDDNTNFGKVR